MALKRLWDTENKKPVWALDSNNKPYQVWTNDDGSKLYVYDKSEYVELETPSEINIQEYGPVWKQLEDETVGYYLTNNPTNLYNWDQGEDVSYVFNNYDGTELDSGKIKEGETPEYDGETPEKPADEENEYTFSGWKPTVKAIYKKTVYTAQFTATPIEDEEDENPPK